MQYHLSTSLAQARLRRQNGTCSWCCSQIDFVRCDVGALGQQSRLLADTVIMNPPFGTRRKGADMDFLRAAFQVTLPDPVLHPLHSAYCLRPGQALCGQKRRAQGLPQQPVLPARSFSSEIARIG